MRAIEAFHDLVFAPGNAGANAILVEPEFVPRVIQFRTEPLVKSTRPGGRS